MTHAYVDQAAAFRKHAHKVGLTYSCPVSAEDNPIPNNQALLDELEKLMGPGRYIVATELHESGKKHYHVYYHADTKIDTTNARFWDLYGVHPNILKDAPGVGWQAYCQKDKEFITNMKRNNWSDALSKETVQEALEHLWQTEPKEMCVRGKQVEENIRKRKRGEALPVKLYYGPYHEHYYPKEWDPTSHSLLLWGEKNTRKTQFARYLLSHLYGDYHFAKAKVETLKGMPTGVPFIYDEVYMHNQDPNDSRELTDVENGGSVTARYGNVDIPPGVPRIFTANLEYPFKNPHETVYGRRVVSHYIPTLSDAPSHDEEEQRRRLNATRI